MRMRKMVVAVVAAAALALAPVDSAYAAQENCTQGYLVCLNEASQEKGFLWRTAMEVECGLEYFGCLRNKAAGS